ncbi:MAG: ATP-binding protein [Candidatus Bathyarchaeota archaeon]|nr:ATP-binding protein [Candidatus Bathyarchaeota archaeon]
MYEIIKRVLFLSVPFVASLCVALILAYLYYRDRNKRKLLFALGLFLASFSFYNSMLEILGQAPLFKSTNWLLIPLTFAVPIAALSSIFKIKNFEKPFLMFLICTVCSVLAVFVQVSFENLRLALMVGFTGIGVPPLAYLAIKSRDSLNLQFLLATLCFLFQGITMEMGSSEDIPVLLALFGVVFIGLMFVTKRDTDTVSLASFIVLEKKLNETNEKLKAVQEELLKAERLAAIGELASILGHDLRNPLQGIAVSTYYLKTKFNIEDKGAEIIKNIETCIERSNKIINDLIEYSEVIQLELTETNPKRLVDNALGQVSLPTNVKVVNQNDSSLRLEVDSKKIERVFVNIIKNAFDAMPNGGTLTIRSKKTSDCMVFTFEDTGEGMTEETLSKLWKPLFTTKAKGMGFGLVISKRFVEAHNDKITVQSIKGKGSEFTVTLPLDPKPQIAR